LHKTKDQYKKLNKKRKYTKIILANPKCLVTSCFSNSLIRQGLTILSPSGKESVYLNDALVALSNCAEKSRKL